MGTTVASGTALRSGVSTWKERAAVSWDGEAWGENLELSFGCRKLENLEDLGERARELLARTLEFRV